MPKSQCERHNVVPAAVSLKNTTYIRLLPGMRLILSPKMKSIQLTVSEEKKYIHTYIQLAIIHTHTYMHAGDIVKAWHRSFQAFTRSHADT